MKVHYFDQIQKGQFDRPIATIGIFDGVHKGHQYVLNLLKEKARELNRETLVVTLWPHPRMVLFPEKEIKLLTTLEEKIELLERNNIDNLIVIPFNKDVAQLTAQEFVQEFLVEKVNISALLVGFDNHFGKNKEGNYDLLKQESEKQSFELLHPAPVFEGRDRISSTDIRLELELGSIEKANKLLGYEYFMEGKVVAGRMLGRTIGFPTANIQPADYKMVPRVGVYAVLVKTNEKIFKGMLNIGFRPTVEQHLLNKSIEVHLLGFNDDLYNKEITVTFVARLRDEIKFSGIDALKAQLETDKQNVSRILENRI